MGNAHEPVDKQSEAGACRPPGNFDARFWVKATATGNNYLQLPVFLIRDSMKRSSVQATDQKNE